MAGGKKIVTVLKPGCSKEPISPAGLPDKAGHDQPAPWSLREVGNGHCEIRDANGVEIYHVFCWSESEWAQLNQKWLNINGVPLVKEN